MELNMNEICFADEASVHPGPVRTLLQHCAGSVVAERRRNREQTVCQPAVEAWDASTPPLGEAPCHMKPHTLWITTQKVGTTHQCQDSDARAGEGRDVEAVGHLVLMGEERRQRVNLICLILRFLLLGVFFLPLWSYKLQTESSHKLSRAPHSKGGALLHIRFVYSVFLPLLITHMWN